MQKTVKNSEKKIKKMAINGVTCESQHFLESVQSCGRGISLFFFFNINTIPPSIFF